MFGERFRQHLGHSRNGVKIDSGEDYPIGTPWDEDTTSRAIEHFAPTFVKTGASEVQIRIGQPSEIEQEDIEGRELFDLDTLHIVTFHPANGKQVGALIVEMHDRFDEEIYDWLKGGRKNPPVEVHPICLRDGSSEALEEAKQPLNIFENTHIKVYPVETPQK